MTAISTSFFPILVIQLACVGLAVHADDVSSIVREVNPEDWVTDCAYTVINTCCRSDNDYKFNYSSYEIKTSPSGLCKPEFSCAWENYLSEKYSVRYHDGSISGDRADPLKSFLEDFVALDIDNEAITFDDIETAFPGLALPSKISFPPKPSDIVTAIEHAKEEGIKVSILSSGHSHSGASSAGGSLQLNMREYPKYSATSITECEKSIMDDPSHPDQTACKLATARNKKALMRIGGGENFNDAAGALSKLRDESTSLSKHLMLHGGAGTVGVSGGWLQGGGLGWGAERLWGMGVDQVLELELVLADGRHVRLHPTEWEDSEGFMHPKTTKVEGFCNTNAFVEDENDWNWEPCEDPAPPFEDLWFAVRGGGGGTHAALTSVKIQVHEAIPIHHTETNTRLLLERGQNIVIENNLSEDDSKELFFKLQKCMMQHSIDFLFKPELTPRTKTKATIRHGSSDSHEVPGWKFSTIRPRKNARPMGVSHMKTQNAHRSSSHGFVPHHSLLQNSHPWKDSSRRNRPSRKSKGFQNRECLHRTVHNRCVLALVAFDSTSFSSRIHPHLLVPLDHRCIRVVRMPCPPNLPSDAMAFNTPRR